MNTTTPVGQFKLNDIPTIHSILHVIRPVNSIKRFRPQFCLETPPTVYYKFMCVNNYLLISVDLNFVRQRRPEQGIYRGTQRRGQ